MEEDKIRQQARKLINEKYPYLPFDQWGYFEDMFINGWNQALSIANVVGQSEQLAAFLKWYYENDECPDLVTYESAAERYLSR